MMQLADLRCYAVARSLFPPTDVAGAIARLWFVQADPIRAPARAQDLVLRHRVADYRVGDLDRLYPALDVEEDFFVNYGFLPRAHCTLMHPRSVPGPWSPARRKRAQAVLEFVRERGAVHPRDVEARFAHGAVVNAWGGSSNATTDLLDAMHYRGMLRVVRRENGIRIYGARPPATGPVDAVTRAARLDALVDVAVAKYTPFRLRASALCCDACASARRSCVAGWTVRSRARSDGSRTRGSGASTGTGRMASARRPRAMRSTAPFACSRRSTRSYGIAPASNGSGDGRTASRPTRRRASAGSATTRCRCCGASG